jgi:hypothetical protein
MKKKKVVKKNLKFGAEVFGSFDMQTLGSKIATFVNENKKKKKGFVKRTVHYQTTLKPSTTADNKSSVGVGIFHSVLIEYSYEV